MNGIQILDASGHHAYDLSVRKGLVKSPQHILYLDPVWSPYSQEDSKYIRK
jgi:hypothetical protein